jgi:hypothetical protein
MFWDKLVKRRPIVSIEDFCRNFYDSSIFQPNINGRFDTCFDDIVGAERSFATTDRSLFYREMTSISMELFGLAWTHYFKRQEYLLKEIDFTKKYLELNGHNEIWDVMFAYNKIIADSAADAVKKCSERMQRAQVVFHDTVVLDLWKVYEKKGIDPSCAARVLNRMLTEVAWDNKITLSYLAVGCAERLGYNANLVPEALLSISVPILGAYNDAKQAIRSVKVRL